MVLIRVRLVSEDIKLIDLYPLNMSSRLCCRSEANASDLQQSLEDMFSGIILKDF